MALGALYSLGELCRLFELRHLGIELILIEIYSGRIGFENHGHSDKEEILTLVTEKIAGAIV